MIYKELVNGEVFTTNNKNLLTGATRIEVLTKREYQELQLKAWWKIVLDKYFKK